MCDVKSGRTIEVYANTINAALVAASDELVYAAIESGAAVAVNTVVIYNRFHILGTCKEYKDYHDFIVTPFLLGPTLDKALTSFVNEFIPMVKIESVSSDMIALVEYLKDNGGGRYVKAIDDLFKSITIESAPDSNSNLVTVSFSVDVIGKGYTMCDPEIDVIEQIFLKANYPVFEMENGKGRLKTEK